MIRKTAVVYARVSTAGQAADDLPIDSQIEQCRAKAAELGAEVVRVFADRGISGRKEMRAGFQDAVAYCIESSADLLITWDTKRFARDHIVAAIYKQRLAKSKVQLVYCTSSTADRTTVEGFILDSVTAIFDEAYCLQVAADTKRSMLKNARDGFFNGGGVPLGYKAIQSPRNPLRRELQIDPEEAWIVTQIFKWRLAGLGTRLIAGKLNEGAHTFRGRLWRSSTIHALLRNRSVNGYRVFNKRGPRGQGQRDPSEWVMAKSHEAIIDDDLWEKVQAMLSSEAPAIAGSPKSTYLFTGILKCGHCGGGMQIETAKGRGRRYSYYNCATWMNTRQCRQHRRPANEIDTWLMDTITHKVFTAEVLRGVAIELNAEVGILAVEREAQIKALSSQLADATKRKRKLFDILELQGRDAPNLGDLTNRLRELADQAKRLTSQIGDIEAMPAPQFGASKQELDAITGMLQEIVSDQSNVRRSRSMLRELLESVVIHSDRAEINYRTAMIAGGSQQHIAVHSSENWLRE